MTKQEKQFNFALKLWEDQNGKKYTGSEEDKKQILKMVEDFKQLMEVA